ncbi:hypothetical protein GCM10010464_38500 [Pseudonocardia yunnanensis]
MSCSLQHSRKKSLDARSRPISMDTDGAEAVSGSSPECGSEPATGDFPVLDQLAHVRIGEHEPECIAVDLGNGRHGRVEHLERPVPFHDLPVRVGDVRREISEYVEQPQRMCRNLPQRPILRGRTGHIPR